MWQSIINLMTAGIEFFGDSVGSYGLGIILLTICFRMLLLPLTYSQNRTTRKMQELNPELEEIQDKYEGNQEKVNEETMKLWKENNVNPAAGCLPMLLQMPIIIAMFRALRQFDFGAEAAFLWLPNLAEPDPIYLLPVLAAIATFTQTQVTMTGAAGDQQGGTQNLMKYGMPLFVGYISTQFPAGLALYWTVTNIFGVGQQFIVNAMLEAEESSNSPEGETG